MTQARGLWAASTRRLGPERFRVRERARVHFGVSAWHSAIPPSRLRGHGLDGSPRRRGATGLPHRGPCADRGQAGSPAADGMRSEGGRCAWTAPACPEEVSSEPGLSARVEWTERASGLPCPEEGALRTESARYPWPAWPSNSGAHESCPRSRRHSPAPTCRWPGSRSPGTRAASRRIPRCPSHDSAPVPNNARLPKRYVKASRCRSSNCSQPAPRILRQTRARCRTSRSRNPGGCRTDAPRSGTG